MQILKVFLHSCPFVATPLKGRFVVFLKWLLIGYIGLGDCPAGLELPQGLEIGENHGTYEKLPC